MAGSVLGPHNATKVNVRYAQNALLCTYDRTVVPDCQEEYETRRKADPFLNLHIGITRFAAPFWIPDKKAR